MATDNQLREAAKIYKPSSGNRLDLEKMKLLIESKIIPFDTPLKTIRLWLQILSNQNLDPFTGDIIITMFKVTVNKGTPNQKQVPVYNFITTIKAMRKMASASPKWLSSTAVFYNGKTTVNPNTGVVEINGCSIHEHKTQFPEEYPNSAIVGIARLSEAGTREVFIGEVYWDALFPARGNHFWKKSPYKMLGKCAEADALRKAFPLELEGLHLEEELKAYSTESVGEAESNVKKWDYKVEEKYLADHLKNKTLTTALVTARFNGLPPQAQENQKVKNLFNTYYKHLAQEAKKKAKEAKK